MRSLLTPTLVANLVRQSRQVERNKTALLLEGERDSRVYGQVIDSQRCRIFPVGNRLNVIATLEELKRTSTPGVLAVIDADTDHLERTTPVHPDLLMTDSRDVEGIILRCPVVSQLLVEHDLDPKLLGANPEATVLKAVKALGYIRWLNEKLGWHLKLSGLRFSRFINPNTLVCNLSKLCAEIERLNSAAGISKARLAAELTKASAPNHDPAQVARGHDVSELLAWVIQTHRRRHGKPFRHIHSTLVESQMRLAYSGAAFASTALFNQISDWETRNAPYVILRR